MKLGNGNAGVRCHTRTSNNLVLNLFATFFVAFFVSASAQAASVVTDTTDYPPGATVTITGAGFTSLENVTVQVTHLYEDSVIGEGHDPWTVSSDLAGGFITYWDISFDDNLAETLLVTATGQTSGLIATTTFVDAPPAANLDQYRNGSSTSPVTTGSNWVNGNAGSSNSHYVEGFSVPYRLVMTDLPTATTITIVLGYDIKHSGVHALDYLTHFNRLNDPSHTGAFGHSPEPLNPIAGVSGLSATVSTFAFPTPTVNLSVDPDGAGGFPAALQPQSSFNNLPAGERVMTLYGGTITNIQYDPTGTNPQGILTNAQSEARMQITFTVNSATAVFAWGGHIASRTEWGLPGSPQSAGGVSGSPYHMRTLNWNLNNLGNQDRSLSAGAVFVPDCPTCNISGTAGPVCPGSSANTYSVTVTGTCQNQSAFTWTLSNNTSGASFNGSNIGSSVSVNPGSSCGGYRLTSSFTCSNCGSTPVTCFTDVTVQDNTAPTVTFCPPNATIFCPATPVFGTPTFSDNCDQNLTITINDSTTSGACPQEYSVTRTTTATDDCGNTATCAQTINVVDTTAPQFVDCPSDLTVECDAVPGPASPSATDNCGNVTINYLGEDTTAGACPQSYTLTRKWEAIDECGNADTCTQVITVDDTTAPQFVDCPADTTVECDAVPAVGSPTATDNCDTSVTINYLGEVNTPGACPQSYTLTRKWEAKDDCGNADTCEQEINVVDTTSPVLSGCPNDTTISWGGTVPAPANVTADDNCDLSVDIVFTADTVQAACVDSIIRKWVATDDCGNKDSCLQTIVIQTDNEAPVIANCPNDTTVSCDEAVPAPANVTANDNCDTQVDISFVQESSAGNCPQEYTLTRTWIAVDDCSNADTCTQVITVVDTTVPVLSGCPNDTTISWGGTVPAPANVTADDNCDLSVDIVFTADTAHAACVDTIVRKWVATDDCGNKDSCLQTIVIQTDNEAPIIANCPADTTVSCDVAVPAAANVTANDNCDTLVDISFVQDSVADNCPQEYTLTRTWIAVDDCANADTCIQIVSVVDTTAPAFDNCPSNLTASCDAVPAPVTVTATDNCDPNPTVAYLGESSTPGNCPQSYTLTRSWTATDACGNADTCVQLINVVDTTKPVCSVPNDTTIYLCDTATICFPVGAIDNCDPNPACIMLPGSDGNYSNGIWCYAAMAGTEDVQAIFQCTDACGNVCIDTINVHLVVNTPPSLTVEVSDGVLCNGPDTVCVPFTAIDPDNGLTFQTAIGWVDAANGLVCFFADTSGTYCNLLRVTDSCGLFDEVSYCVQVEVCNPASLGADRSIDSGFVCSNFCDSVKFPTLSNGCGPFAWYVNGVTTRPDTTLRFCVALCTDFNASWTFVVYDSACSRADTAIITYSASVNCPPVVQCPSVLDEVRICRLGDAVCVPGIDFSCTDDDNNVVSTTLNGVAYSPGDDFCFVSTVEGVQNLEFICTDACGRADTCTATVEVIVDPNVCSCPDIVIEKVHNVIQGQYTNVSVIIENFSYQVGGLNLLIQYDPSALSLSNVTPGTLITDCGWEYFTFRNGAAGNCGSTACPSGKVRIIAIAETNNGNNHPSCFQLDPSSVAELTFLVTNDRTLECQFVPIRFCWYSCGDNSLSSVDGDTLYISSSVNDWVADGVYNEITNVNAPFPGPFGANISCEIDIGDGKPDPIRCVDFFNGGIDIICADSIDDRGDINLNGVSNEVADVVLLGNYFIYGIGVFTVNVEGQIAASDVNADGTVLSVADLVYLIRIVIGDAAAYSKVTVPVNVSMTQSADGILMIEDKTDIGAAFILVAGQANPVLLANQMDMDYNYDGVHTRILVWSTAGNSFTGDFIQVDGDITLVEMATAEGNPVALNTIPNEFTLNQNYPNPFNPTTVISFSLPTATNYELTIFNISGQQVASFVGAAESAGTIEVEWEAGDFASGIYFYKLRAGDYSEIKKMMLIK